MYKLRELEQKDLIFINKWRNDSELISMLGAPFRFINLSVDEKWFDGYMNNRGSQVRCAIIQEKSDEILGLVSLLSIDHLNQSAELHIMIGNINNQRKGIGTFAVQAMIQHAFQNLNLQRIELSVVEDNKRAQHLYEKCGFVKEGVKRKAKYKNGRFVNIYFYSILKSDYFTAKEKSVDF